MKWLGSRFRNYLWAIMYPSLIASAIGSTSYALSKVSQPAKAKVYKPKIFNSHEFVTLKVLTETILRDDEMPGVREAKANEFIDFQITYDPELQERFHEGLLWLDRHSRRLHGKNFVELKSEQRKEIIQCLEIKARHRHGEEQGREFFGLTRRYTYMGFYASEEALRIAIPAAPKSERFKRRRLAGAAEELNPTTD